MSDRAETWSTPVSPHVATDPTKKISLESALSSARETRALSVGPGVLDRLPELFRSHFPGQRAVVVADSETWAITGETVHRTLRAAGLSSIEPFVFGNAHLHAEFSFVEKLEASFRQHDAIPIAVGAGTINDVVKLAAHRAGGRSYLCVATAASMDGYTAFGASITYQGAKQTFDCPAPRIVIADTDVICRAPFAMTAAGYADLQAKVTAGADWILADALAVEPIDPRAWEIVQSGLAEALADPAGARAGNVEAIAPLIEGLMLGGFAMQWTKSSRPASGAEHQLSHLWDMEHHVHNGWPPSHGFKVGIATLAVTALYEEMLRRPLDSLELTPVCAQWPQLPEAEAGVRRLFATEEFLPTALQETRAKYISGDALRVQLQRLQQVWPALRSRLQQQLLPFNELRKRLQLVGAPVDPLEIGITHERLRASFLRAHHIRRRFTVLDLVIRTGQLESCLDAMFGPGGAWDPKPGANRPTSR